MEDMMGFFIFLGVAWFISSVALLARNASLRKTAKNYIDNVSDPNLKAALLKIKNCRGGFSDSEIEKILNVSSHFFALKGYYNDKAYFKWILKDKNGQCFQIDFNGKEYGYGLIGLYIQEIPKSLLKFHPEQHIFTGASVGGVFTGGVHTQKAYMSESFSSTGKYGFFDDFEKPEGGKQKVKIEEIYLCDELLKKVPDNLKKYVKGGKFVLYHDYVTKHNKEMLKNALALGDVMTYNTVSQDCALDMQLSLTECHEIYKYVKTIK